MSKLEALPLAPLETIARLRAGSEFGDPAFAEMVGVSSRTILRWRATGAAYVDQIEVYEGPDAAWVVAPNIRRRGVLPWTAGDECATALGCHASTVWPDEWAAMDADILGDQGKHMKAIEAALDQIGEILRTKGTMPSYDRSCAAA